MAVTYSMSIASRIIRWLYRVFTPVNIKNTIRLQLLLDSADRVPEEVMDFKAKCVVVLAPHMDDEIIGCGGVLQKHIAQGARVIVAYLTDGRRGNPDLYTRKHTRKELQECEKALVSTRKSEARNAASMIGISDLVFLDNPDGELTPNTEVVRKMRGILASNRPEFIYLPSLFDPHCDHWATNMIFYSTVPELTTCNEWRPICRGYEVWTPLFANRLVNINNEMQQKIRALRAFESQTAHIDYVRIISGLNAYRSIYFQKGEGYAEAFWETTLEEYDIIFQAYLRKK